MKLSLPRLGASIFALGLGSALPAAAQMPIAGNYGLGAGLGQSSAILPPPGTHVIENGWIGYDIDRFVDGNGKDTGAPGVDVRATRLAFRYVVPDVTLLGGDYAPGLVLTYRDQVLRPEPGSKTAYQPGDAVFTPIALGWHQGTWHTQVSYTIWIPTGKFEEGGQTNTGKGLWSQMFYAGTTWRQETDLPWAVTLQARYETFGKQKDTDIRPGDVFSIEAAIGKEVVSGLSLGLLAATSFQVTQQTGTPGGNPDKYRINIAGGEIVWKPKSLPGAQVALRVGKDFDNRNTSEGIASLLSLAYAF
ncbi:transporter [Sedimentitalea sp. JM2-8]|uniref:Transporter n=1 Tax=Sedimentitalea xiamensis TaxID=3050037 RepID=A0ABT7FKT4_9RHOB|nr:transporter [Sedimentitalea xiamensis]MDK3075741.1 transporter [Sedimentitalea xiamensis]